MPTLKQGQSCGGTAPAGLARVHFPPNWIPTCRKPGPDAYALRKPKDYQDKDPGDNVLMDTLDLRILPNSVLSYSTVMDEVHWWDVLESALVPPVPWPAPAAPLSPIDYAGGLNFLICRGLHKASNPFLSNATVVEIGRLAPLPPENTLVVA